MREKNPSTSSRTKRAATGTVTGLLQYAVLIGMQVLLVPLVLHTSGQETLGAYSIVLQIVSFVYLVDLGFGVTLNRFLAQATSFGGQVDEEFESVFAIGRTFYLASNTVAGLILFAMTTLDVETFGISPNASTDYKTSLIILAIWSISRTPLAVYGAALTSTHHQSLTNMSAIVGNICRLTASVTFLLLGWGLTGLIVANVLGEATMFVLQRHFFVSRFGVIKLGWRLPNRELNRKMFSFGGSTFLLTLGNRMSFNSHSIIVGALFGAVTASIYYSTQMPAFVAFSMIYRLAASAEPAINELVASNNFVSLRSAYFKLHRLTLLASVCAALLFLFLGKPTISLWVGASQFAGMALTTSLAITIVVITFSNVDYTYLIAKGSIGFLAKLVALEGAFVVITSILVASIWGFQWIMAASLAVMLPRIAYQSLSTLRFLNISVQQVGREVIVPILAPLGSGLCILLIMHEFVNPSGWLSLIVVATAYSIVFALTSWSFALSAAERSMLRGLLRR